MQIKLFILKLMKPVISAISGPGIKELEYTTQPLSSHPMLTTFAFSPPLEGASSIPSRKGNNAPSLF